MIPRGSTGPVIQNLFWSAPPPSVPLYTWLKRLRLTAATLYGRLGDEVEKTLAGLADEEDKEVKNFFDEGQALRARSFYNPTSRVLHPVEIMISPRRVRGALATCYVMDR